MSTTVRSGSADLRLSSGRKVVQDSAGNLYAAFLDTAGTPNVVFEHSTDGGATWSTYGMPAIQSQVGTTSGGPALAVDGSDTVHIVVSNSGGLPSYNSVTSAGVWGTWFSLGGAVRNYPALAAKSDGTLLVVYRSSSSIIGKLRTAGSWGAEVTIHSGPFGLCAVDSDSGVNFHLAYSAGPSLFYCTWNKVASLPDTEVQIDAGFATSATIQGVSISTDASNHPAVIWEQALDSGPVADSIALRRAPGGTWAGVETLHSPTTTFDGGSAPTITTVASGFWMAWVQGDPATGQGSIYQGDYASSLAISVLQSQIGHDYQSSNVMARTSGASARYLFYDTGVAVLLDHSVRYPNAPVLNAVTPFDAAVGGTFTWTFSDPHPGSSQSAYQLLIVRTSDGAVMVNTGKATGAAGSFTLGGGFLANPIAYGFQVRTWNQDDVVGPYSGLTAFTTVTRPVAIPNAVAPFDAILGGTFTWTFSDPDPGTTQGAYEFQIIRTADGVLMIDASAVGATASYTLAGGALANNIAYRFQVRVANQAGFYGPFCAPVDFVTDRAPFPPVPTPHGNFDATTATTFIWTFSDPDPGNIQSAYQFQVVRQSDSAIVVDSGKAISGVQGIALGANTLVNGTAYQFKVRAWDQFDVASPYSALSPFVTSQAPSAIPGARTVFDARLSATFTWTFTDPDVGNTQSAFELLISRVSDGLVLANTGKLLSTTSAFTLTGGILANGGSYQYQVRVWDNNDVAGAYSSLVPFVTTSAPNAPVLSAIPPFDATAASTFTWTFSDPDVGDTQSAYQFQVMRQADGAIVVDSGEVVSSLHSITLPGNTLINGIQYQYQVRVWDNSGLNGPYSLPQAFVTSAPPTAAITTPNVDGSIVGHSRLTVSWTLSDPEGKGQSQYRVLLTSASDAVLYDSGIVVNAALRNHDIAYSLVTLTNYKIKLTAWDADGIASAQVVRTFSTDFSIPLTPKVKLDSPIASVVRVMITNPDLPDV